MDRKRLLGVALAAGLVAAASPSRATPLVGDQTIVLLTSASALVGAGLGVTGIAPGVVGTDIVGRTEAAFPITGGDLTLAPLAGTIEHAGGLLLDDGATSLVLENFLIDFGSSTLSADVSVDGMPSGSAPIASVAQCTTLAGTSDRCVDGDGSILLDGWKLSLTADATDLLQELFGVGLPSGFQLGVARIDVRFVPEPGTAALVSLGLFAAARRVRRSRAGRG